MGRWLHHGGDVDQVPHHAGEYRTTPADSDSPTMWSNSARSMARGGAAGPLQQDGDTKDTEEEGEGEVKAIREGPVGSGSS